MGSESLGVGNRIFKDGRLGGAAMEEDKKKMLQYQINCFVGNVLNLAEKEGKLDHLEIEISNHQGNLQMDYRLRDRKKVY